MGTPPKASPHCTPKSTFTKESLELTDEGGGFWGGECLRWEAVVRRCRESRKVPQLIFWWIVKRYSCNVLGTLRHGWKMAAAQLATRSGMLLDLLLRDRRSFVDFFWVLDDASSVVPDALARPEHIAAAAGTLKEIYRKSCCLIVAIASASYRIEKPSNPENRKTNSEKLGKNRRKIGQKKSS